MKKLVSRKKRIQKAIVLPLIALLLSTSAVMADTEEQPLMLDDWAMEIPDTQTEPGVEGLVIPVNGIWADDISQYRCNVTYDPNMIELTEVNLDGCAGEGFDVYLIYGSDYFFIMAQGGTTVPAGEGSLVNIVVNITEEPGVTEISFQGGQDQNLYKSGDGFHYPTLYGGIITIGEQQPELAIESIEGGIGISAVIKNVGEGDATEVNWSIELKGGIIIRGGGNGTISNLPAASEEPISALVISFGKSTISIIAQCAEGVFAEENADCFVFVIFVFGVS